MFVLISLSCSLSDLTSRDMATWASMTKTLSTKLKSLWNFCWAWDSTLLAEGLTYSPLAFLWQPTLSAWEATKITLGELGSLPQWPENVIQLFVNDHILFFYQKINYHSMEKNIYIQVIFIKIPFFCSLLLDI